MSLNTALKFPFRSSADSKKKDFPEPKLRTTPPSGTTNPVNMGGNIIRVVEDFSTIEINELNEEIRQLDLKMRRAQLRQEYVKRLRLTVEEYNKKMTELV